MTADLDKLEALARKAYLANEVVAMIPPAKILDLIAQARASQPEGATGTTGAPDEWSVIAQLPDIHTALVQAYRAGALRNGPNGIDADAYAEAERAIRAWNLPDAAPASAQPDRGAAQDDNGFRKALEEIAAMRGKGDCASDLIDIADSALAGLYATSPASQPVAPETAQGDAEFLSVRLARVARAAGVTMPEGSHDFIAGVAGTILGDIARKLESAPSDVNGATACQWPTCLSEVEQDNLADEVMRSLAGEPAVASSDAKDAAPTTVPEHSEREAANAGGRIIVPEWVYRSARDLAVSIWRDNYKDTAPQWEPLDDLAGVVSQIDNMVTGMRRVTGAGNRPEITDDELVAFNRFCECAEDFDSGGHDVPKEMMKRLAVIGLVRPCGFGRHETTLFGDAVRNGNAPATIAAGQEAANAKDAARYRFLRNQASQSEGFPPADGACWVVQYHHPRGTVPELTSAGYFDKLDRAIDAAMTTVGARGPHVE